MNKVPTFLFKRECGCFLFELLQDGVLPPLKCPLCPEGVSLSAAKSDRQSGALKAHTPFSIQRLWRKTPGLRSRTHRLRVFRVSDMNDPLYRTINTTKRQHLQLRTAGVVCVKVLCVKSPFISQTLTIGCLSQVGSVWLLLHKQNPFFPSHPPLH